MKIVYVYALAMERNSLKEILLFIKYTPGKIIHVYCRKIRKLR